MYPQLAFNCERERLEAAEEQARARGAELGDQLRVTTSDLDVARVALADAKATIADVTRLRWEVEGREGELQVALAAAVAERDELKKKLELQQEDSVQLLLQLEQLTGEKQRLDWLVSEGKKQVATGTQSVAAITKDRDAAVGQVELLRAKLEQANNKNDVLRENYEMLDTKLTQAEEKAAADSRHMAQLQKEERRMKEEVELMRGQMKTVVAKAQALEKQMATADGNVLTTEQQLRRALVAGAAVSLCDSMMLAVRAQLHVFSRIASAFCSPTPAAAERNEAHTLVQFDAKARALDAAQQQVRPTNLMLFAVISVVFVRPEADARAALCGASGDGIPTRERKSRNGGASQVRRRALGCALCHHQNSAK